MERQINEQENSYGNPQFSNFYDFIIKKLGREELDSELLKLCSERFGGPILEMGCGTGNKLIPLAKMGFSVVGLDNSPQMLSLFEEKLNQADPDLKEKVQLIFGDMTNPPISRDDFRLIIFSGSQFLHLNSDEQRLACLKNSRRLLADNGVIVISSFNSMIKSEYDWIKQPKQPEDEWTLQVREKLNKGAFQTDFKLVSKSQAQEYVFQWRYYPVSDISMKELIKQSGLECIPWPPHFPVQQGRCVYLCTKSIGF